MCWPATSINNTIYLPCPNYINKFNQKSKFYLKIKDYKFIFIFYLLQEQVFKHCLLGPTNKPNWSLTNFSFCLQPSDEFVENLEESTLIDVT